MKKLSHKDLYLSRAKTMSNEKLEALIQKYEANTNKFIDEYLIKNLGQMHQIAIEKYVKYLSVEEQVRLEYEKKIEKLRETIRNKDGVDSMYMMMKMGRIYGLTEESFQETVNKRENLEQSIKDLKASITELEEAYPDLRLRMSALSLDEIETNFWAFSYFEKLMTIKALKDELISRENNKAITAEE